MKLQDLHVLMAVVQAGSMRKAAAHLNTTQPSISRSIAELEDAVGVPLLDRNPHGVEPTTYGRALLDGGVAMFDDLRQAVKNIEFLADPEAGEVRIGSGHHHAPSFVSAVVERISRRYPRIVFRLVSTGHDGAVGERALRAKRRSPHRTQMGLHFRRTTELRASVRRPEFRGGGHAASIGSPAPDRARRGGQRTVDAAAAGKPAWRGRPSSLSRLRPRIILARPSSPSSPRCG